MMTLAQADIDPTIRPYWRWQAALDEVNSPSKRKTTPEPEIAELMAYLRGDPCPRRSVIDAARKIFEEDGLPRAELESRILSGQSDEEIASRCDLPAEVVAVYEEMFFFVRRYLHEKAWRRNHINDVTCSHGYQNHQLRQLWAWFALVSGPIFLDSMIEAYRAAAGSETTPRIDFHFSEKSPMELNLQARLALHIISSDWDPIWILDFKAKGGEITAIQDLEHRQQKLDDLYRECISVARQVLSGILAKKRPRVSKRFAQTFDRIFQTSNQRTGRQRKPDR